MRTTRLRSAARGAALVVGMVLLVILTLLAISGMNTSTTELFMAGNEMYQQNAFRAAETGIERSLWTANFNPDVLPPANPPPVSINADDAYAVRIVPLGDGPPPATYSYGEFGGEYFEIESTGTSSRNATTTHTQGLILLVPGEG